MHVACIFRETCCIYNNTLYPLHTVIDTVVTEDNCSQGCILRSDDAILYYWLFQIRTKCIRNENGNGVVITSFTTYNSHHCHDKVDDMIQEAVQMEPPTTTQIPIPTPSCTCGRARTITRNRNWSPRIVGGIQTKVRYNYHIMPKHFLCIGQVWGSSYFILSEKQISMDGFCGNWELQLLHGLWGHFGGLKVRPDGRPLPEIL